MNNSQVISHQAGQSQYSFIPGLKLCGLFYQEAVKPILDADFPTLQYSAALIGEGSEVLGFDTGMSTDHDWGPRLLLFVEENDCQTYRAAIHQSLAQKLPRSFRGYSTSFASPTPQEDTDELSTVDTGQILHLISIGTLRSFFLDYLDFDINDDIELADWLTFTEQKLRSITGGAVYHDDIGLQSVRERFKYYPDDVWLYLLAAGWTRIGQEEHLMGRAGSVGDELGSALIASRLVRDLMRLCFLMEKQYAPYAKWFGTAFQQLSCAGELSPILRNVQLAADWQEREMHLCSAYEYVATMHNALHITKPLSAKVSNFFNRPFKVIHLLGGFAEALCAEIKDPAVQQMAYRRLIGSIDQFSDSTDILSSSCWRRSLRRLYE